MAVRTKLYRAVRCSPGPILGPTFWPYVAAARAWLLAERSSPPAHRRRPARWRRLRPNCGAGLQEYHSEDTSVRRRWYQVVGTQQSWEKARALR